MKESTIQKQIIQYLSMMSLRYGFVFFSVPNEGIMSVLIAFGVPKLNCIRIIEHFKQMGLLPGVSDIVIIHKGLAYCLEVKTETGSQSKEQIRFEGNVLKAGGRYGVARSFGDAEMWLKEWGVVK